MGPETRAKLISPDPLQADRQDLDAILATTQRLLAEMEALIAQSKVLHEKHTALMKRINDT